MVPLREDSFWYKAALAAVGPVVGALLGSLVIGLAVQLIARRAQDRRAQLDLRRELVEQMTQHASELYMHTQLFWRARTGKDPGLGTNALDKLRQSLDEQYVESRAAGLVLESRLDLHFASPTVRQAWHKTMDFLTIRYFQVLENDRKDVRLRRLEKLYRDNGGPECTGLSPRELNKSKNVLAGYRRWLREATLLVQRERLRDAKSLKHALSTSESEARNRAEEDLGVEEGSDERADHETRLHER